MKKMNGERKELTAYAWPGGYPVMYLARDGWREEDGTLDFNGHDREEHDCCAKCAANVDEWPDLIVTGEYVHYEGPAIECEYCNGMTESAYGDPEEENDGETTSPQGA